jgi:hypothetical protein
MPDTTGGRRLPASAPETKLLKALGRGLVKRGTADRRFIDHFARDLRVGDPVEFTEEQRVYLWRIAQRYRDRLSPEVAALLDRPGGASGPAPAEEAESGQTGSDRHAS